MIKNLAALISVCSAFELRDPSINSEDPTTYSNYQDAHTTHVLLELSADFERKILNGVATHQVYCEKDTDTIVMDYLGIEFKNVTTLSSKGSFWEPLTHALYEPENPNPATNDSSAIQMTLSEPCLQGKTVQIKFEYTTDEDALALNWVDSAKTDTNTP